MSFSELIEQSIEDKLKDVELGMVCKIETFDKTLMRADVQPLMKIQDNENDIEVDLPILSDIPILFQRAGGFFIRPVYASGDLVWVGFSSSDIENALKGYSRVASEKSFELQNACVLGGIAKDNFVFPTVYSKDGLIIGHETSGIVIRFTETGIFVSNGVTEFNLLTHTHPTAGTGAPSPPTPGS